VLQAQLKGTASSRVCRPNVLIIFTDDQGYGDLSCLGNPVRRTHHCHVFEMNGESYRFQQSVQTDKAKKK